MNKKIIILVNSILVLSFYSCEPKTDCHLKSFKLETKLFYLETLLPDFVKLKCVETHYSSVRYYKVYIDSLNKITYRVYGTRYNDTESFTTNPFLGYFNIIDAKANLEKELDKGRRLLPKGSKSMFSEVNIYRDSILCSRSLIINKNSMQPFLSNDKEYVYEETYFTNNQWIRMQFNIAVVKINGNCLKKYVFENSICNFITH